MVVSPFADRVVVVLATVFLLEAVALVVVVVTGSFQVPLLSMNGANPTRQRNGTVEFPPTWIVWPAELTAVAVPFEHCTPKTR